MSWLPFWTYSINGTAFALVALSAVCGWSVAIIQVVMLRRADARAQAKDLLIRAYSDQAERFRRANAALQRVLPMTGNCPGCGAMLLYIPKPIPPLAPSAQGQVP